VFGNLGNAIAQTYGAQELDQSRILLVSAPGSRLRPHQLYIIEQISDDRPCYTITGSSPGEVNPLWTTFDFSGICGRASDTNGYSIRTANEDLGIRYRLQIRESDGELLLLGVPSDRSTPLQIGRTGGISSTGFTQIILNPGWRVTKRTFEGQTLGHNYLTNEATLAQLLEQGRGCGDYSPDHPHAAPHRTRR
jgi:N-acetylmuramoyl-L-alanine amidase